MSGRDLTPFEEKHLGIRSARSRVPFFLFWASLALAAIAALAWLFNR